MVLRNLDSAATYWTMDPSKMVNTSMVDVEDTSRSGLPKANSGRTIGALDEARDILTAALQDLDFDRNQDHI